MQDDKETWDFLSVLFEDDARRRLLDCLHFPPVAITKPRLPPPDQPATQQGDVAAAAVAGEDGTALDAQLSHLSVSNQPDPATAAAAAPAIPAIGDVDFFDHYADGAAPSGTDVAAGSTPDASAGSAEGAGGANAAASATPTANGAVGGGEEEGEEEEEEDVSGDRSWEAGVQCALVVGDYEAAVEACIAAGRVADALLLAAVGGFNSDLWARTQRWYLNRSKRPFIQVGGNQGSVVALAENSCVQCAGSLAGSNGSTWFKSGGKHLGGVTSRRSLYWC